MKAVITTEFLETIPAPIRKKLRLVKGMVLDFDENTPYLKATSDEATQQSPDEFNAWLTESIGMAKGKFSTDQLMSETRGEI
jgi:bifunctional DNA-binding transcriptional regulator/antitoxin component of YhaV-PrlF toxin-antitoxin module